MAHNLMDSATYLANLLAKGFSRSLLTKASDLGFSPGQFPVLIELWNADGLTQRELSRRIGTMEPTTLAAIVQMEKSGFVTRVRGTLDRRRQHIYLTEKGRAAADELLPLAVDVVRAAAAGLSLREIAFFLDILRTIQANLDARLDPARAAAELV